MPLTVEHFTQRLTSSGVMSKAESRDWLAIWPVAKPLRDGEQLARELVQQERLTKYQAEQLCASNVDSLTLGNYVILDKLGQSGMVLLDVDRLIVSVQGYTYCLDPNTGVGLWANSLSGMGVGIPCLTSAHGSTLALSNLAQIAADQERACQQHQSAMQHQPMSHQHHHQ